MYKNSRFGVVVSTIMLLALPLGTYAQVIDNSDGGIVRIIEQPSCNPDTELIVNGGFESPQLDPETCTIVPSSGPLGWFVDWASVLSQGTPGLEIENLRQYPNNSGNQHAELDGYHPTKIWQNIQTIPGKEYELTFAHAMRADSPLGETDNTMDVLVNGVTLMNVVGTSPAYTSHTQRFIADNAETSIAFVDTGADNSYGNFLDDVSLRCAGDPIIPEVPGAPTGGGGGSSTFDYWGCTNQAASNFNSLANKDDGSCKLPPQGEVLGASITTETVPPAASLEDVCVIHKNEILKYGGDNQASEVIALQLFLNKTLHLSIFISGIYNIQTHDAVKSLQATHTSELLTPWATISDRTHDLKYWLLMTKCGELNIH